MFGASNEPLISSEEPNLRVMLCVFNGSPSFDPHVKRESRPQLCSGEEAETSICTLPTLISLHIPEDINDLGEFHPHV